MVWGFQENPTATLKSYNTKHTNRIYMDKITTTDLADFGSRERKLLCELLNAWREQGLPEDFEADEVVPMFNKNSGLVFLTNSEFQSCLMNGNKLDLWCHCSNCGHEGFLGDGFKYIGNDNEECFECFKDIEEI